MMMYIIVIFNRWLPKSLQEGEKKREIMLGRFLGIISGSGLHPFHSYSIDQNSVIFPDLSVRDLGNITSPCDLLRETHSLVLT